MGRTRARRRAPTRTGRRALGRAAPFWELEEELPETGGDPADWAEEREEARLLRQAVEELHMPHDPDTAQWVTISIGGVTVVPPKDSSYDAYLKIADTMLYDAKRTGRNKVVWANEKMEQWRE